MKNTISPTDRLMVAANAVFDQALENPDLGIPTDPDVADFMGCFEELAVSLDDFINFDDEDGEPNDD